MCLGSPDRITVFATQSLSPLGLSKSVGQVRMMDPMYTECAAVLPTIICFVDHAGCPTTNGKGRGIVVEPPIPSHPPSTRKIIKRTKIVERKGKFGSKDGHLWRAPAPLPRSPPKAHWFPNWLMGIQ